MCLFWLVQITNGADKVERIYGNYFPRRFYYKRDAAEMLAKIRKLGADANVTRETADRSRIARR